MVNSARHNFKFQMSSPSQDVQRGSMNFFQKHSADVMMIAKFCFQIKRYQISQYKGLCIHHTLMNAVENGNQFKTKFNNNSINSKILGKCL